MRIYFFLYLAIAIGDQPGGSGVSKGGNNQSSSTATKADTDATPANVSVTTSPASTANPSNRGLDIRPTPGSIVRVPETHSTGTSAGNKSGHHSRSSSGSTIINGSNGGGLWTSTGRNGHSRASSVDVRPVQYVANNKCTSSLH